MTLDVDANGILKVLARDKASGKEQSIRIEASSGLAEADIERMRKEADQNTETDKKKLALVEARNGADQIIYSARKALTDNKDKIPSDLAISIDGKIAELEGKKKSEDAILIKTATEELSRELSKVYEALQKQSPEQSNEPPKDSEKGDQGESPIRDADVKGDEPPK